MLYGIATLEEDVEWETEGVRGWVAPSASLSSLPAQLSPPIPISVGFERVVFLERNGFEMVARLDKKVGWRVTVRVLQV
jgi:hypothetical protein